MSKQHDVFLSYSRVDEEIMQRVYQDLTAAGLAVWIDKAGIPVGSSSWRIAIQEAIECSACLIVILSPDAKKSKWVNEELSYAETHKKQIFAILAKGDEQNSVPFGFSTNQWVDIRTNYKLQSLVDALPRKPLQISPASSANVNAEPRMMPKTTDSDIPAFLRSKSQVTKQETFPEKTETVVSASKPQAKEQIPFYIGKFNLIHFGTISSFGIENEELVRSIAWKLAMLSTKPTAIAVSRMGEAKPIKAEKTDMIISHKKLHEVKFLHDERLCFDKIFIVLLCIGQNTDGNSAFAYVNIRGDRLENLLFQDEQGRIFNISNYATMIQSGIGEISTNIRQKLERDYLFYDTFTNVRMFPPLKDVR